MDDYDYLDARESQTLEDDDYAENRDFQEIEEHDMEIVVENRRRKKLRLSIRRASENWDFFSTNETSTSVFGEKMGLSHGLINTVTTTVCFSIFFLSNFFFII